VPVPPRVLELAVYSAPRYRSRPAPQPALRGWLCPPHLVLLRPTGPGPRPPPPWVLPADNAATGT